jgi:ATP-binding cassette, subfamily B (MDR/TAP), member 1
LKILKNVNLTFEPGQKVALVGESGSGKSTIVNLLERLYDSIEGTITIDGMNIREFDVNYLRSLIGYVQQEPVLFNKSIKENIIFGRDLSGVPNVDDLIKEACEDAYANEFIKKIDGQYNYVVGIKGSKLSGGQKQRVAIARAILTKPKILLLDEATSALDNKSEKEVQKALDIISQKMNVTTIIIAHRLSTVKNADKIYAIKNGVVLEEGNHKELLARNGYYAGLVKSQMAEEELNKMAEMGDNYMSSEPLNLMENEEMVRLNSRVTSHASIHEDKDAEDEGKIAKQEKAIKLDRSQLFSFLKDNKCNIFLATVGSAINGAIFPVYGMILASAINSLSSNNMQVVKDDGIFFGMMFLVIAACSAIANLLQYYKFTEIGEILSSKLRKAIFEKYLRLHLGYFDKNENSPGALLTKLSIDTTLLNGIVLTTIGVSVQSFVCFALGIALGFSYDWRLSLINLAFYPFIITSTVMTEKMKRGSGQQDNKVDIEAGSILSECVVNTKSIFSYNFQDKAIDLYADILKETKGHFGQSFVQGMFMGVGQFCTMASTATIFYASGKFIMQGTLVFDNMTRAFMSIMFAAFGLGIAQQNVGDVAKAKLAFESIFSTLNLKSEIDNTEEFNKTKITANNIMGKIEFRNVSFAYPTRPKNLILKNLNFTILPGQSAAFVGYSGSGKSTIVQLLERYYDVNEGKILIDDVDIRDYNLLELRKKIGLVSQEPVLFKRSVRDNILYGDLSAQHDQVTEAAKKANIMKFFTSTDDGTKDTPVSGGEKQRLAIARAFLKNPKILLLDEATSALDKDSENEVQKALYELQGGRTSITIAHRLSTIENSDLIFVLEHGIIVEQGTHRDLYEKKGKYYTLHKYSLLRIINL